MSAALERRTLAGPGLALGSGRRAMRGSQMLALAVLASLALLALLVPVACPDGPFARAAAPLTPPGEATWLGTDDLGRSVGCQIGYGLRASLMIALGTLAITLVLGVGIGLLAGYFGGLVDAALARLIAAFQVVPRFFLAIVAAAFFGPSQTVLIVVLGLTSWPLVARIVRAETFSIRARPFVMAATALGCSTPAILRRHILPAALPPVRAASAVIIGAAVLAEAALGFIGLGDSRSASLGRLIAEAYPFFALAPWMSLAPVTVLAALILAVHTAQDRIDS